MGKIKELVLGYWQYGALAVLALTAGIVWLTMNHNPEDTTVAVNMSSITSSMTTSAMTTSSTESASSGYVYISGAVKHPGLYHVTSKTRWADVVQAAGGLTKDADTAQVNLAQIAHDEENMAVPIKGATATVTASGVVASGSSGASGANASSTAAVNLNTATVTDLQTISGIGPKRAQDIIDYRDQHGGFKSIDELKDISGIGDKTFADMQASVTVGP